MPSAVAETAARTVDRSSVSPLTTTPPQPPSRSQVHAPPTRTPGSAAPSRPREESPERPPVSPITPKSSHAELAPVPHEANTMLPPPQGPPPPKAEFIEQPPPVSIAETENPDAAALRSAIAVLQIQKQKSQKDIQKLQEVRNAAIETPHEYAQYLQEQQRRPKQQAKGDVLGPTFDDIKVEEEDDESEDEKPAPKWETPSPQNIIRCPPINWDKYHVVGGSLDKIHQEQVRRPPINQKDRDGRNPVHKIAAPYNPFTEKVTPQPKKEAKKAAT